MTPPLQSLEYLFTATFDDDTSFSQTQADVDSADPKRSAFTEYLRICKKKKPTSFRLTREADGHTWQVNLITGAIYNGLDLVKGTMPEKATDLRIIYLRQVSQHHVLPATFHNPQGYKELKTGHLLVRDSKGNDHIFPETARMQYQVDGESKIYFVYPRTDTTDTVYILGCQATIDGKNIHQTVKIE